MVKHRGNKSWWYVDYGETTYYGIYVTIVRGFTMLQITMVEIP